MYLMMAVLAVVYTPWAIFDRRGAFAGIRAYCRYVRWSAGWMIGLKSEIRGEVPRDEVMIASKHQSFFDIIMICSVVPRPKFIMKKQLVRAPILGWYALRIGCVPVDRGKRGPAMEQMVRDVAAGRSLPGQLIIYPQGTRVAPRATLPYKIGTGVLYRKLGQPCVPAATNVGVFWPRSGVLRKPGTAVVDFLDPIPPGQEIGTFMTALEEVVETRSKLLMAEAGLKFDAT
ncbi:MULTISPECIES: lysophospholipid acyltransferase family protein [unclassified Meridianimarinicoccus]|uniref:lysophospholipid acyltransferase family protein n=1 Tax=unclassified Meridianimarinicoccus TaxID=2923344 RepID=UPI001868D3AC|nr:lysophospholipid acyltransferase family protein [Fluviibacterium sp. MJW13]